MGVYSSVITAVQTRVTTIIPNTVLRKKLEILEGDTFPLAIIAPGEKGEKIVEQTFGGGVWYGYPVLVAYVVQTNDLITTGLTTFLDARETLRNELYQVTLPGVSEVIDTDMNPEAAVKLQAFVGSNYTVTGFEISYKSVEERVS